MRLAARSVPILLAVLCLGLLPACGASISAGAAAAIVLLDDDDGETNDPPAVRVEAVEEPTNDVVPVRYTLTDPDEGDRADVIVEYSLDGGSSFRSATPAQVEGSEGTTGLETSAAGTSHVFHWNAIDIPRSVRWQNNPGVLVRITPVDTVNSSREGDPDVTPPFTVRNLDIATVLRRRPSDAALAADLGIASDGDVLLADGISHRALRIDSGDGTVTRIAGTEEGGFDGDALLGPESRLNFPLGIAEDPLTGEVFLADTLNGRLRRLGSSGVLDTVLGGGDDVLGEDILAENASLFPMDIAFGPADGNPLVAVGRQRVRFLNLGSSSPVSFPPGDADQTNYPFDFTAGAGRVLSIIQQTRDDGSHDSAFYEPLGEFGALAASSEGGDPLVHALVQGPDFSTRRNDRIVTANFSDSSTTLHTPDATGGTSLGKGNALVVADENDAGFPEIGPHSELAVDGTGRVLFIASLEDNRVDCLNLGGSDVTVGPNVTIGPGEIKTVVGTGDFGFAGDGGPPELAELAGPVAIALDANRNLYVAESTGRLRVVNDGGMSDDFGAPPIGPDEIGSISAAPPDRLPDIIRDPGLIEPFGVTPTGDGALLVADLDVANPRSLRLLRVDSFDAEVTSLAGTGVFGETGDGSPDGSLQPATDARLGLPGRAAVSPDGTIVCVPDIAHHSVRALHVGPSPRTFLGRIIEPGEIRTVVGTGDPAGPVGDGGDPALASLDSPLTVAFDDDGLLWVSDTKHHRVRVCNPGPNPVEVLGQTIAPDTIETIVGDGTAGSVADETDDQPASSARLRNPALVVGDRGHLWILDGSGADEHRVRLVNLGGRPLQVGGFAGDPVDPGEIETVIGSGASRSTPDISGEEGGPATAATFRTLSGLSARSDGLVLVSDAGDHRIRVANLAPAARTLGGVELEPGTIRTLMGTGLPGFDGNPSLVAGGFAGVPAGAGGPVHDPTSVFHLPGDRIVFADRHNESLRMANLAAEPRSFGGITARPGEIVVLAGSRTGGIGLGQPVAGRVHLDSDLLLFTDRGPLGSTPRLLSVDPTTRLTRAVAGTGTESDPTDADYPATLGDGGLALFATLREPRGLDVDDSGSVYLCDAGNRRIRFVNRSGADQTPTAGGPTVADGHIDTIVGPGDGTPGNDETDALPNVDLTFPSHVDHAGGAPGNGVLWVTDPGGGRLLRIEEANGEVEGILGRLDEFQLHSSNSGEIDGTSTFTETDPLTSAIPSTVAPGDVLRITDVNGTDDTIEVDGTVRTVDSSTGQFVDVTILDRIDDTTLEVASTLANSDGTNSVSYEIIRTPGTPWAVASVGPEEAYVATRSPLAGFRILRAEWDSGNDRWSRIRRIAGNADDEWNGDYLQAREMAFADIRGLFLEPRDQDLLLVADRGLNRVVALHVGTSGTLTVAGLDIQPGEARKVAGFGQGEAGYNGDAIPPDLAALARPTDVAIGNDNNIFIFDGDNGRIRRFQKE